MHLWGNSTDNLPQMWSWNATSGLVQSTANPSTADWCIGAPVLPGLPLTVVNCNITDPKQRYSYNAKTGAFSLLADASFCIDAGSPPPNCSTTPFSSYTYCNSSAAPTDRAADLVSRLTVLDMAYVLEQTNPGIPRLGSQFILSKTKSIPTLILSRHPNNMQSRRYIIMRLFMALFTDVGQLSIITQQVSGI